MLSWNGDREVDSHPKCFDSNLGVWFFFVLDVRSSSSYIQSQSLLQICHNKDNFDEIDVFFFYRNSSTLFKIIYNIFEDIT